MVISNKILMDVRFLPGLILFVLRFHGASAFGEEIPAGRTPVPENVKPANEAISADESYVDRTRLF